MGKIGRNAPCPCGSGKKYKKCCLGGKHEPKHPDEIRNDDDFFEDDLTAMEGPDDDFDEEFEDESFETMPRRTIKDEPPEIDPAREAIVDEWWKIYKELKTMDEIKNHIESLLSENPELVTYFDVRELLYRLSDLCIREKRTEEYVELLIRIRNEFPDLYKFRFPRLDRDIISYQLLTGRKDKIVEYLGYYREYPVHDPDVLFELLDLLMANNCQDIVRDFVLEIYHEVCASDGIINWHDILEIVFCCNSIPFLKSDVSDAEISEWADRIKAVTIPLNEKMSDTGFLRDRVNLILNDYFDWQVNDCKTIDDIFNRYDEITFNFKGFLTKKKGMDWTAAHFFRKMVFLYLIHVIPEGKRPKQTFVFTKSLIDKTIGRTCSRLFFLNSTRVFGMLNGLYYFAEYLENTESISEQEKTFVQKWCAELFDNYKYLTTDNLSGVLFEKFPL